MSNIGTKTPSPRDLFERKINHQFGLSGPVLRAVFELYHQGKR
jgi:hypothetical protein